MTEHPEGDPEAEPAGDDDTAADDNATAADAGGGEEDGPEEDGGEEAAPRPDYSALSGIDFSALAPKIDYSALGGIDFSALVPKVDLSALVPKIDVTPFLPSVDLGPLFDVAALAPRIDYSALSGIDFSSFFTKFDFGRLLAGLDLSRFDGASPPNWPLDLDLDVVAEVISTDGIPLVWVPRQAIVEELLAATDRPARIGLLLANTEALIEDCHLVLDQVTDPDLLGQLPLARAAVDAFASGHQESAQALATVLTETLIAAAVSDNYTTVKKQVLFDVDNTSWHQLRLKAALAPIYRFYTTWYRRWGTPPPEALSRHVTVHEAGTGHYTPANALLAVLLVASVARAVQELNEARRRKQSHDKGGSS